jgi:hypothetical protein
VFTSSSTSITSVSASGACFVLHASTIGLSKRANPASKRHDVCSYNGYASFNSLHLPHHYIAYSLSTKPIPLLIRGKSFTTTSSCPQPPPHLAFRSMMPEHSDMLRKFIDAGLTFPFPRHIGTPYSPSSPTTNSSDTTSPVYPDRPIRPLPKRPLRSRLSPEAAESIKYPPAPNTSSLFYPYSQPAYSKAGPSPKAKVADIDKALIEAQKTSHDSTQNGYQFRGSVAESDDEDSLGISQQRQVLLSTPSRSYTNGVNRTHESIAPSVSSHESVDGYDSFENTNNKKKRKIPISGSLGSHHSSLSAEMASMDISPSRDIESTLHNIDGSMGQYCGASNSASASNVSGTGISGAGRGRYGRSGRRDTSGRSPLGVSTNASNAWQQGRLSGSRRDYSLSGNTANKGTLCFAFGTSGQERY